MDVGRHPNITLFTYSQVESISGYVGNFHVKVLKKARFVKAEECTACGECVEICPVEAIKIVKDKAQVDYSKCVKCYCCHEVCTYDAIKLDIVE